LESLQDDDEVVVVKRELGSRPPTVVAAAAATPLTTSTSTSTALVVAPSSSSSSSNIPPAAAASTPLQTVRAAVSESTLTMQTFINSQLGEVQFQLKSLHQQMAGHVDRQSSFKTELERLKKHHETLRTSVPPQIDSMKKSIGDLLAKTQSNWKDQVKVLEERMKELEATVDSNTATMQKRMKTNQTFWKKQLKSVQQHQQEER
jgi:archaellum component FlaC